MKDISILTKAGIDVNKSLELFGDMATYDQMLEEFLNEVDGKLAEAKKYVENNDMQNYTIAVHSLKSDVRYFGITSLGDEFYEHELAGKRGDYLFVQNNFSKLFKDANNIVSVLNRYMGVLDNNTIGDSIDKEKKTIIVVDDSSIVKNFIEKIFLDKYNVVTCDDGEEAIEIVSNTTNVACMLLDLNMPKVDGFQVLEYFKKANLFNTIPVSIITGNSDATNVTKAFTYPVVDILEKPFSEKAIKNVVFKTINRKSN